MIHWLFGRIFNIPQIPSQEQATPYTVRRQTSHIGFLIPFEFRFLRACRGCVTLSTCRPSCRHMATSFHPTRWQEETALRSLLLFLQPHHRQEKGFQEDKIKVAYLRSSLEWSQCIVREKRLYSYSRILFEQSQGPRIQNETRL